MRPLQAYRQQQNTFLPRIDLILALYRTGLDLIRRARTAFDEKRETDAKSLLAQAQMIVTSLASGYTGATDEAGLNFLRLYEFVAYCLSDPSTKHLDSAERVLRTLSEGFVAAREEALELEATGQIPPLSKERQVEVSV